VLLRGVGPGVENTVVNSSREVDGE
jgi:hypothetical protein